MLFKSFKKVLIFSIILSFFISISFAKQPAKYQPTIDKRFQNIDLKNNIPRTWWLDILTFSNFYWSYVNVGIWLGNGMYGY